MMSISSWREAINDQIISKAADNNSWFWWISSKLSHSVFFSLGVRAGYIWVGKKRPTNQEHPGLLFASSVSFTLPAINSNPFWSMKCSVVIQVNEYVKSLRLVSCFKPRNWRMLCRTLPTATQYIKRDSYIMHAEYLYILSLVRNVLTEHWQVLWRFHTLVGESNENGSVMC